MDLLGLLSPADWLKIIHLGNVYDIAILVDAKDYPGMAKFSISVVAAKSRIRLWRGAGRDITVIAEPIYDASTVVEW